MSTSQELWQMSILKSCWRSLRSAHTPLRLMVWQAGFDSMLMVCGKDYWQNPPLQLNF
ncbi:MAG: hypothetical protein KME17_03215 [Cyanosarcina radialis HA8281-LM2]|nr:hypothetical protein [Cyanosarcina radialis HA8281-LM2]